MRFYSKNVKNASLKEVLFQGFAPDGSLYLPQEPPRFTLEELERLRGLSFTEIAFEIAQTLFPEIGNLRSHVEAAFNFPVPLVHIDGLHFLELFHGPTLSFKDFGARMLARLALALKDPGEELTVLVATSGDTGSAVGHAFLEMPGVRVFILYPKGNVTPSQEMQITTIGKNVTAVEIEGGFESCQELLKKACLDSSLNCITTGNSINAARLLSHTFYYFYAYSQMPGHGKPAYFSIPCGNFGHLVSGVLAKRMGLPIARFVAATNINDVVPLFLHTGVFQPHDSYRTMAVSMDVGNPSNFPRLLELYQHSLEKMRAELIGISFTDGEITRTIRQVYETKGYLLDPHSAIAYLGLKQFMEIEKNASPGLFFATAHPGKFRESLEPIIGQSIPLPEPLQITKPSEKISCPCHYEAFKELLLSK